MKQRIFGKSGIEVSEIGYGMWQVGGQWGGPDDEPALASLQLASDLGCNFFDTAWAYGDGHSEGLLGRLIAANPSRRIVTATKVPPKNWCWPSRREFTLDDCFPPDHIREYLEKSLINTGIDCYDLVQLHTWEDRWLDDPRLEKVVSALKDEGLCRQFGVSLNRWEPWNGVRAARSGYIDAVQVIYNIFDQNPEDELFPACVENGVAVIARVPFDEGTLTGTLTKESTWPADDWRASYFVKENLDPSVDRAEALRPLVPAGMTMAELALRFILANPAVSTVIPGMRKESHVRANLACGDGVALPGTLLAELKRHRWDREPTEWSQ